MKILIADKIAESGLEALRQAGHQVEFHPAANGETLKALLKETASRVLVVRSTRVMREMIEGSKLALIVRAGAGVNTIDVDAASEQGVFVANCPGQNALAVAELAFGLILSLDRRIPDNVIEMRAGRWDKQRFAKARGLAGQRLGLIGIGHIGKAMIPRAQAFQMNVIGWSRSLTPETAAELGMEYAATPKDVAANSDILSIHLALTPQTRGVIDAEVLSVLPRGAMLINASRAEIVDSAALKAAIEERGVRVGLDVFDGEPEGKTGEIDDPLALSPSVYGTHHIGASTDQALEAVATEVVRVIQSFVANGRPGNAVNMAEPCPACYLLAVRHLDRVGVLADVLNELRRRNVNVQQMENLIFARGKAALARIHIDGEFDQSVADEIVDSTPEVLGIDVITV